MAFGFFETSRSRGAPIQLFRFRYGVFADEAFCYTDGEREYTHMGLTYKPLPIKRTSFVTSAEKGSGQPLQVSLPGNTDICQLFRVSAPPGQITLTVFQGHARDPDSEFLAIWIGRVSSCGWSENDATLVCESAKTQLRRLALRRHYQYMCPHVLYGDQCRASEAAASTPVVVNTIEGRFVTINGLLPNKDRYVGGMLKFIDAKQIVNARAILSVAEVGGNTRVALSGVIGDLVVGMVVNAVRGCTHTLDGCATHANVLNFGGQPYIPITNPLGVNGAFS